MDGMFGCFFLVIGWFGGGSQRMRSAAQGVNVKPTKRFSPSVKRSTHRFPAT
jgi:hypothetical protein